MEYFDHARSNISGSPPCLEIIGAEGGLGLHLAAETRKLLILLESDRAKVAKTQGVGIIWARVLAQKGVQMIAHNTLSASDYGILDEITLEAAAEPLGSFVCGALGTTVLNPGEPVA
jgi:hypothetical protein